MSLGNIGNYIDENWHGGQIDGDFFDHPEIDIEENIAEEKKENKLVWNWKHAVIRELMRGKTKSEILSKYKDVIKRFGINDLVCKFLNKNYGVIGYFIVDVSNFDDKFKYEDMPQELRECNLYAINSIELREVINRSLVSEDDGSMDGFLNSNDSINEEIYYLDECTGLPAIDGWDGESDDEDERLNSIANLFLGKKWMTLSEKEQFNNVEGKLPYLINVVRRAFTMNSNSTDKFDDDVNDFEVTNHELEADSQKYFKDAEVTNLHENTIDDIGNVDIPEKINIKDKVFTSDFFEDVSVGEKVDSYDIKNELKKSDYRDDFVYDKKSILKNVENIKEQVFEDIDIESQGYDDFDDDIKEQGFEVIKVEVPDYGLFSDNMTELSEKDYRDDIVFDNMEDFVIEDIKDMKDDDFDYADLNSGDVDIDEMMEDELYDEDVDIDEAKEEIEISNKYDWSW